MLSSRSIRRMNSASQRIENRYAALHASSRLRETQSATASPSSLPQSPQKPGVSLSDLNVTEKSSASVYLPSTQDLPPPPQISGPADEVLRQWYQYTKSLQMSPERTLGSDPTHLPLVFDPSLFFLGSICDNNHAFTWAGGCPHALRYIATGRCVGCVAGAMPVSFLTLAPSPQKDVNPMTVIRFVFLSHFVST